MTKRLSRYVGDRAFYASVLAIVVPMIIQNGITNFVNLLDNLMVGQIGTEQMSGVSLANQLVFVFALCVFGGLGGIGIFTAQFFGAGDDEGVRRTCRIKLYLGALLMAGGAAVVMLWGGDLIQLFLQEEDVTGDVALTLRSGHDYLLIMLVGLVPFTLTNVYASTLRECGQTRLPMLGGLAAVLVNLFLNWVLIYGMLGAPAMGVQGAAWATVISRFVELAIVVAGAHANLRRFPWLRGVWRSPKVPLDLLRRVIVRGLPLLFNEALWSTGMSVLVQCYSTRGLIAVAGLNIANTVSNLFNIFYFTLGNAVAIMVGQTLGTGDMEKAHEQDRRLMALSLAVSVGVALALSAVAPFIPLLYNTTDEVRALATRLIWITALCTPIYSFCHCAYFTLRSGGKTVITFIFDCGFMWLISIPVAFALSRLTALPILPLYLLCQSIDLLKCGVGYALLKSGMWLHNLVAAPPAEPPETAAP